jgi:hypothetical protein
MQAIDILSLLCYLYDVKIKNMEDKKIVRDGKYRFTVLEDQSYVLNIAPPNSAQANYHPWTSGLLLIRT